MMLTPKNYTQWIAELKGIATAGMVWEYIDPNGSEDPPTMPKCPEFSDYNMVIAASDDLRGDSAFKTPRRMHSYMDLTHDQQKDYKQRMKAYKAHLAHAQFVSSRIQEIQALVFESARPYISTSRKSMPIKDILKSLQARFRMSDSDITRQFMERYSNLRFQIPSRPNIEHWVAEWENLYEDFSGLAIWQLDEPDIGTTFMAAGEQWVPDLFETGVRAFGGLGRELNFFNVTKAYRKALESHCKDQRKVSR